MSLTILSGVTSGQVLQRLGPRGADATITGTATEDGPLRASLLKAGKPVKGWSHRNVGRIARGKFRVVLSGLPTGGPYHLRLEGGSQRVEIAPLFVGDVWILAGQSNMEGVGNMTGPAKPHPLVRAFSMRRVWRLAEDPLHQMSESPDACHAALQCTPEEGERARKARPKGVGAGVFFAREMIVRTGGVSQGLICTAHGGTSMQQWSPARKRLGGNSLYASMLMSVQATGQPVAGLLWYQGESDANPADAVEYTRRMRKLVAATRRDLRQPRLPWVIVQIARHFTEIFSRDSESAWNSIQDQQRRLPGAIPHLETVSAIDLPLDDPIHIGAVGYTRLGVRLARAADRMVHGNKDEALPPQIRSVQMVRETPTPLVEVKFANISGGLRSMGEPHGFAWVSTDGVALHLIYKIELAGDVVRLHLTRKPDPGVRLHYGHGYAPFCNITDARDFALPVAGPLDLGNFKARAYTAFVTEWNATPITAAAKPLDEVTLEEVTALPSAVKKFAGNGMVNEHGLWEGKRGHAFFRARVVLGEPMKLNVLMGYDGPFRVWLDGKPFYTDMAGINPCLVDAHAKKASLAAGPHDLVVGMDLNNGMAWGFFLRFERLDVTPAQRRTGQFARPVHSV